MRLDFPSVSGRHRDQYPPSEMAAIRMNEEKRWIFEKVTFSGGYGREATPDPIPNSEVKLVGADGTAGGILWESRTSPG